jgi:hypothetical protein
MKATILFRITACIFVLFAVGHTFGFLSFKAPTPEGRAVEQAMESVHFEADGKSFSYGGFYRGFGLSATASMLFEAFLAWQLGTMARRGSREVTAIGWAFFLWQIFGLVLAWLYFGIPPLILASLVTVLIAVATWMATANLNTKAATAIR